MRKIISASLFLCASLFLVGCGGGSASTASSNQNEEVIATAEPTVDTTPKFSNDRHLQYVKNYVGLNAASVGYASLSSYRMDQLGSAYLKINYINAEGEYVDPTDDECLKQYIVTGQSPIMNTEVDLTFTLDENGEEYENLVNNQSYDEILLSVKKIDGGSDEPVELTAINPSDRYTRYVRNYVGRNLANCGYAGLDGKYHDEYDSVYMELVIAASDGTYIDPTDVDQLSKYVVVSQSIPANTACSVTYTTDEGGNEYDGLIETQTFDSIQLNVEALSNE